MLSILLVLVLLLVALALLLWLGSLFAQSYFYTEPAEGLLWRAPAAAGVLVAFYLIWSLLNLSGGNAATDKKIPYPSVLNFNNTTDLVAEPVPEFESKRKNTDAARYKLDKTSKATRYKKENGDEYWNADGALYVKFKHAGTEYNFVPDTTSKGDYREFVDRDTGWVMQEQRIGVPSKSSAAQVVIYFLLNVVHLVLCVLCVWVLLQYAPGHAVVLGGLLWVVLTLFVLPILFDQSQSAVG